MKKSVPDNMSWLEALTYMDDICHKRKMPYDPHELKQHVEKEVKVMIKIHNQMLRDNNKQYNDFYLLVHCIREWKIDIMEMLKIGLQRYNYLHNTKYSLELYNALFRIIFGEGYMGKDYLK